jgi:hypothetical protein
MAKLYVNGPTCVSFIIITMHASAESVKQKIQPLQEMSDLTNYQIALNIYENIYIYI